MKMTKGEVYNRLTEELIQSPEKLSKMLDQYGQMGVWFIFQHVRENNTKIEALEKKLFSQRRQAEDLEVTVKKLQASVRSLKQAMRKGDKPLMD